MAFARTPGCVGTGDEEADADVPMIGGLATVTLNTTTLAGTIAIDRPSLFLWGTLLALALGSVLLIADRTVDRGGYFVANATIRPGA